MNHNPYVGLKGVMNEMSLEDLARMTRRGMLSRAQIGRLVGGIPFGYRSAPDAPHGVEIAEEDAAIVREICSRYAEGESPRSIAKDFNARGISPPRGTEWRTSVINGDRKRQNRILENPIYEGKLIWGRSKNVKDPQTRRVRKRLRPESEWSVFETPALRIIDEETWATCRERKAELGGARLDMRRRPKRLLSGLIKCGECGECGGNYIIYYGERMACSSKRDRGACSNSTRLDYLATENAVLDAIREQMLQPEAIEAFVACLKEALHEQNKIMPKRKKDAIRRRNRAQSAIKQIVELVKRGDAPNDAKPLFDELGSLQREKDSAEAEIARVEASEKDIALPDNADVLYERQLKKMRELIVESESQDALAAREVVRSLVEKIVARPTGHGELSLEVVGKLGEIAQRALGEHLPNDFGLVLVPPPRFERGTS